MVTYIRSDLEFILKQIKIAEDHALYVNSNGADGRPLFGPGVNGQQALIPTYNLAWGLRTVDGSYNHLLPGQIEWGAADNEFPEHLGTDYRSIMVPGGPGGALVEVTYTPGADNDGPGSAGPGDVFDPTVRTISNLLVDQTLGNPSAILTGLQRAGLVAPQDQMAATAAISAAYEPLKPLFNAVNDAERAYAEASAAASASPGNAALQQAAADAQQALDAARAALDLADDALLDLLSANGIELEGANVKITNAAPDEGLSAPFNSWFTLFGQFFDHGLDLVAKGGSGTVFIPLQPDDPLYVPGSPTNFMVLTRATLGRARPRRHHRHGRRHRPSGQHHDLLRRPEPDLHLASLAPGVPARSTQLERRRRPGRHRQADRGRATAAWRPGRDVKAQAAEMLGIQLTDSDVGNVPLLRDRPVRQFIPRPERLPQMVTGDRTGRRHSEHGGRHRRLRHLGRSGRRPTRSAPATPSSPTSRTTRCRSGSPTATSKSASAIPDNRPPPANTTTNCSTRTSSPATAAPTRISA